MMRLKLLSAAVMAACMLPLTPAAAGSGSGDVTLIHTGDIHGHLLPRAQPAQRCHRPQHGRWRGAHVHGDSGDPQDDNADATRC